MMSENKATVNNGRIVVEIVEPTKKVELQDGLQNIKVELVWANSGHEQYSEQLTDASGQTTFDNLDDNHVTYTITPSKPGYRFEAEPPGSEVQTLTPENPKPTVIFVMS